MPKNPFIFLLCSWLIIGLITMLAGFTEHLAWYFSLLLLVPAYLILWFLFQAVIKFRSWSRMEKTILVFLVIVWIVHLTGVLVPETGFDAVWYHLPIVHAFAQHQGYFYWPTYYQSLNPFFSDGIFLLGYMGLGEFGAKLVAFLFALSLMLVGYLISRQFLRRSWSLLFLLTISTFQVITWQAASFYVDVTKAFWEMGALFFLLRNTRITRKNLAWSGLFFGASLGTKLFSLFLLPIFGLIIWRKTVERKKISILIFSFVAVCVTSSFYFFAYDHTQNPFYSLALHTNKLAEIGGNSSLIEYGIQRTTALPTLLIQLTLFSRDYTSLLFLVFAVLPFIYWKDVIKNPNLRALLLFSIGQLLLWWYLPPLSTRYAISGFIGLAVVLFWCLQKYVQEKPKTGKLIVLTIILAIFFNLFPRTVVLHRNLQFIFGWKSRAEYLQQFYDGSIDANLKSWQLLKVK